DDIGSAAGPSDHRAGEGHRERLAGTETGDSGDLPSAEDSVRHAGERVLAALAKRQIVSVIDDHVVRADGIGIAPVQTRVEGIGGSGDSKGLFGERLVELILGLEGEAGRDAADHAKLNLAEE